MLKSFPDRCPNCVLPLEFPTIMRESLGFPGDSLGIPSGVPDKISLSSMLDILLNREGQCCLQMFQKHLGEMYVSEGN